MGRGKLTWSERLAAVKAYLNGEGSYKSIAKRFGIHTSVLIDYVSQYQVNDTDSLCSSSSNKHYTAELKRQAVEAYLAGEGSQRDICARFKIKSRTQLRDWMKVYNDHKEIRSSGGHRSELYMTKGRTTTLEERVEIVAYCLEHGKDYGAAIEKYSVSYQQIYSWVRKYEEKGVDGLIDRRGKAKSASEMTEVDRLNAEIRMLKAKNRQLQLEADIAKKLAEIEGRRD